MTWQTEARTLATDLCGVSLLPFPSLRSLCPSLSTASPTSPFPSLRSYRPKDPAQMRSAGGLGLLAFATAFPFHSCSRTFAWQVSPNRLH